MSLFDHDAETCRREPCGRCREKGTATPPKQVDHDVAPVRTSTGRRELDIGRLGEQASRRLQGEGRAAAQHFYEWERESKIAVVSPPPCQVCDGDGCETCNGTGNAPTTRTGTDQMDREASLLRGRWVKALARYAAACGEIENLLDQAKVIVRETDKQRSAVQVEADGWCGSCWKATGEFVPIALRPSGEPFYRGRCRFCGSWPEGDPPKHVLETKRKGSTIRVQAS